MTRSLARKAWGKRGESGLPLDELMIIAQDALIAAARLFEPERGVPFRVFAWPRVRGALSRSVAVAGRHGWLERELHGSTPAQIQAALDRGDLQHELRELLTAAAEAYRQLPQDHATLIRAHYLEGKSLKAIADEMGLGGKRVYGLHQDALVRMRHYLRLKGLLED